MWEDLEILGATQVSAILLTGFTQALLDLGPTSAAGPRTVLHNVDCPIWRNARFVIRRMRTLIIF
jgi:hypothetical protein